MSLGTQHHEAVDNTIDVPRLLTQFDKVMNFMSDGKEHDLYEIAAHVGCGTGAAASQLRNARVDGERIIKRRHPEKIGTWLYQRVNKPVETKPEHYEEVALL